MSDHEDVVSYQEVSCSICLGNVLDSSTVGFTEECHHGFCLGCLASHFEQSSVCPLCRGTVTRFAIIGASTVEYSSLNVPLVDGEDPHVDGGDDATNQAQELFRVGEISLPFIGWGDAKELRKRGSEKNAAEIASNGVRPDEDASTNLACLDWHFFSEEASKLQRRCEYLRASLKGSIVATFARSSLPTDKIDQLEDAIQLFQIAVVDVVDPVEKLHELYAMEETLAECEAWRTSNPGARGGGERKLYGANDLFSDEEDDETSSDESDASVCGPRGGGKNGRKADERESSLQHRRGGRQQQLVGPRGEGPSFVLKEASSCSQKEKKKLRYHQAACDSNTQRDFRRALPRNL